MYRHAADGWCLNCHRNPAVNLRPTSEIYNMAWEGRRLEAGMVRLDRTAGYGGAVNCTTVDPSGKGGTGDGGAARRRCSVGTVSDAPAASGVVVPASYQKFTSQMELQVLTAQPHSYAE
jgi:hypothetical protein